jgi:GRAM domain
MGWLKPDPELDPAERVVWKRAANLSLSTAEGGTLYVTTTHLRFVPHRVNWRAKQVAWPLPDVESVAARERDGGLFTGGMRNRLQVCLRDGDTVIFVVNHVDAALSELRPLLQSGSRTPPRAPGQRSPG